MGFLVNSSEMRRADAYTIHQLGMPAMVLMERAALCVVEELFDGGFDLNNVLVICGAGNNGGDGFAIARLLLQRHIKVRVLFVGEENKCTEENTCQMKIARNYGVEILNELEFDEVTTLVDALFGIGLTRRVEGEFERVIDRVNSSKAKVLSVDMPSGISTDTGEVLGTAIKAERTVTFAYNKFGLTLQPGADYAGIVKVVDIGITDISFNGVYPLVKTLD